MVRGKSVLLSSGPPPTYIPAVIQPQFSIVGYITVRKSRHTRNIQQICAILHLLCSSSFGFCYRNLGYSVATRDDDYVMTYVVFAHHFCFRLGISSPVLQSAARMLRPQTFPTFMILY